MQPYTPPSYRKTSFNCPQCGAFAQQRWYKGYGAMGMYGSSTSTTPNGFEIVRCSHCKKHSFWLAGKMIYPVGGGAPVAHIEMPEDVKRDYDEARNILGQSPRSAAALLRLAVQKLANDILDAERDSNLNDSIKKLVAKGLPETVQKSLDIVRVTGNHTVHPGQIDVEDDDTTASALFELVNIITEYMIAQPKKINRLYDRLPKEDLQRIAKRDRQPASK